MYDANCVESCTNYLTDYDIVTEDELCLVCNINGQNMDTLESILYARTGYHSFNELDEFEEDSDSEETEENDE